MGLFNFLKKRSLAKKLIEAAISGDVALAEKLLAEGADVNAMARGKYGITALMWASMRGHTETVKLLLSNGAKINATGKLRDTALMEAAAKGHTETVKLLLSNDANINATNNVGETALMEAAAGGHTETAKLLLANGAKIIGTNTYDRTELMLAALFGHTETVELLLKNGADVNARDKGGNTALEIAFEEGHVETVKLLKANSRVIAGRYPLYTGTGVCDVCNRPLIGVTAYVVPNHVFYVSPLWRAHFKKVSLVSITDADIERMRAKDHSPGSAVCKNCIHMFYV
jgi:ankyrin repeat protein